MKRATSIFFVLLAGIAILAHSVVPHHHHNKIFAAIVNVLDEDAQDKLNHSHNGATHEHDTHSEECAIDETVAGAVFRLQKDNGSIESIDFDFKCQLDLLLADIIKTFITELFEGSSTIVQTPYTASVHLDYVARSLGLRAPPAC